MKASNTLLRWFICSFILEQLSAAIYNIHSGFVYDQRTDVVLSVQHIVTVFCTPRLWVASNESSSMVHGVVKLIVTLVIWIGYRWLKSPRMKERDRLFQNVQKDVFDSFPRLRAFGYAAFVSVQATLCLLFGCYSILAASYLARDSAILLDSIGFYELGEQVYSLDKTESGRTLSTLLTVAKHDSKLTEVLSERLNRTVAKIYGAESVEMANRYKWLGIHCDQCLQNEMLAEFYLNKAVVLYRKVGTKEELLQATDFLAPFQAENHHRVEAYASIAEIRCLLSQLHPSSHEKQAALCALLCTAQELNDKQMSDLFLKQLRAVPETKKNYELASDFYGAAIPSIIVVFAAALFLKRKIIRCICKRWEAEYLQATSAATAAQALDKLITLELYNRNFERAELFSFDLMEVVESCRVPLRETAAPFRR